MQWKNNDPLFDYPTDKTRGNFTQFTHYDATSKTSALNVCKTIEYCRDIGHS